MGQIKTSISIEENVSSAFKSMNTVVSSTLNTFQNFDNVINDTPTISDANEKVLNSIATQTDNASNSVKQLNNDINSLPNPDYWTNAVGNYSKSALEAVYTTEELVEMGFKSADALKAQENSVESVNNKVTELKANVSQWNSSSNIELFDSTGIERYQQEIEATNTLTNKLVQTQIEIQNQAKSTKLLPDNAINDLNNINNRMIKLQSKIQEIENKKITTIGAEQVNNQVEELREKLNNALQAQEDLNEAMQNMDASKANEAYIKLEDNIRDTEKYIRNNTDSQGKFNESLQEGNTFASNLGNTIKGVVKAYLGIQGAKKAFSFVSDSVDLANIQNASETQLKTVLANVSATENAYDQLYAKASEIQSKGIYGDEAMLGGAAEIATYISDSDAIESMMDTLANYAVGMSGGGEIDKTAMVEYATQLGKALDGTYDGLTKKGFTLTDVQKDIIENGTDMQKALVLDEVISQSWDNLYETMSNTPEAQIIRLQNEWGDIKETVGNGVYPALLKMFNVISSDMPVIQNVVSAFTSGMYYIIEILTIIISLVCNVASFISDNWSIIEPIILGIVTALAIYNGLLLANSIYTGIVTAAKTLSTIASVAHGAAITAEMTATTGMTAAQLAFNAALYACPLTWILIIIIAVIAAIYAIVAIINKLTGSSISATGVICGCINVVLQFFKNLGLSIANIALGIWEALKACASNIGTAFHNAICGVQSWFYNLLSTALTVVAKICEALNKLPFVEFDYSGITSKADEYAAKASEAANNKEEYTSVSDAFNSGMSTFDTFSDGWVSDAYNSGYSFGEGIEEYVGNLFSMDSLDLNSMTGLEGYELSNLANNVADTANNTSSIADSMDITEEDLKYLRDIAEQEVINRFTTASINVEMNNNNNINSETDLDGIVSSLEDKIYEMSVSMAEGVHS